MANSSVAALFFPPGLPGERGNGGEEDNEEYDHAPEIPVPVFLAALAPFVDLNRAQLEADNAANAAGLGDDNGDGTGAAEVGEPDLQDEEDPDLSLESLECALFAVRGAQHLSGFAAAPPLTVSAERDLAPPACGDRIVGRLRDLETADNQPNEPLAAKFAAQLRQLRACSSAAPDLFVSFLGAVRLDLTDLGGGGSLVTFTEFSDLGSLAALLQTRTWCRGEGHRDSRAFDAGLPGHPGGHGQAGTGQAQQEGQAESPSRLFPRPLSERASALVLRNALRALRYLHAELGAEYSGGVLPEKVFCFRDGTTKLDALDGPLQTATRVKRRRVRGQRERTYYLSPEAIQQGDMEHTGRFHDIWSLGIMALALLEGDVPHATVHPMRVLFMIPTMEESPSLSAETDVSGELRGLVDRMLVTDPTARGTAATLLESKYWDRVDEDALFELILAVAGGGLVKAAGRLG
jgi:Protein kinase domain